MFLNFPAKRLVWCVTIAIKLYSPPSPPPPPVGGHSTLARPQTLRPTPTMLENGLSQFMQFRQQQQQAAAAAAAQADLFARLRGPLPRLPLPLPLPFLHAHAAAASAKFGPAAAGLGSAGPDFMAGLRARFHGFAAAASVAAAANTNSNVNSTSPPSGPGGCLPCPPPPSLSLHPPSSLLPRPSPNGSQSDGPPTLGGLPPLMTHVGPTSPNCRNPYDDGPMSPNGKPIIIPSIFRAVFDDLRSK